MLNAVWPVVLLPAALTDGPHEWEMLGRATLAYVTVPREHDFTVLAPSYGPPVEHAVRA
jgi:hypothetical protein